MKYGDKGAAVRKMQNALLDEGYPLPKFGADGDFGNETMTALKEFMDEHSIHWFNADDKVPQAALDILLNVEESPVPDVPAHHFADIKLYDLRDEPWEKRIPQKFKRSGGLPVIRDPAMITGITVHQTAVPYSVRDYQIQAAGGDEHLALALRSLNVACHVMAFRKGFIAAPNHLTHYVYHGNGFNSHELGIEIDGRFPGLIGEKTWDGKKASEVTDTLVRAACAGIEYLVREGRACGMPITKIHAHRQSSATRRSDPGEELWKRVVLDYAVPVLGLKTEPALVLKDGRPIPTLWDENGVGPY